MPRGLRLRSERAFWRCAGLPLIMALCFYGTAFAEGTDQLALTQALRAGTRLFVDVAEPEVSSIAWTGVGAVRVRSPGGVDLGTLNSGESLSTAGQDAGAFGVEILQGQVVGVRWDVALLGAGSSEGHLFSYDWRFNAGAFAEERATDGSFFALVPGGAPGQTAVIELKLDGLAGYVYNINANSVGIAGPNGGRSAPMYGHTTEAEYPIYLAPPARATYSRSTPQVWGLDYIGGVSESVLGGSIDPCEDVVPGQSFGRFQFLSTVEGTYHLLCDLDGDGLFSGTGDDFLAVGEASTGVNTFLWDGSHQGAAIALGTYECRVQINVGEFHYVGSDIETSYPGMRLFEVFADGSRRGLAMHWNDSAVQSAALTMPNGEVGLERGDGLASGAYAAATVPNGNARSWGAFVSTGKGNVNYLDTYVWLASSDSATITLRAVDGSLDSDGDGLTDFEERCAYGTDPDVADSDGDGVDDGSQYGTESSSGELGGLESNSRMAEQLAQRALLRSRVSLPMAPGLSWTSLDGRAPSAPEAVLQAVNLEGMRRIAATPEELPALTNASGIFAADYRVGEQVVASLLVAETVGELYEHSKALCDRAGGAEVLVATRDREGMVRSSYRNVDEGTLDHALVFKLYDHGGFWRTASEWLPSAYPAPVSGQRVLNVQLWGRSGQALDALAEQVWAGLGAQGLLEPSALLDEESPEVFAPPRGELSPTVIATAGELLGQRLHVSLARMQGSDASAVELEMLRWGAGGTVLPSRRWTPTREDAELLGQPEGLHLSMDAGRVAEVVVLLREGGRVVDRLWLSDGAWAPFDDGLWGGGTELSSFATDCPEREHDEGAMVALAGCAAVRAARVDRFAGVARHLPRGIAADEVAALSFWYRSDVSVKVCAEDPRSAEAECRFVHPAPEGARAVVPLARFSAQGDAGRLRLVAFTQDRPGSLEVSALGVHSEVPRVPAPVSGASSCSVGELPKGNEAVALMVVLMAWLRRAGRRFRNR